MIREIEVPFQIWKMPKRFRSVEEVELWLKNVEKKLARQCAYAALARRSQSSRGLLEKLHKRRFSEAVCREVLAEVEEYLDDEEFFRRAIEKELNKGKGPRVIARKLQIEEALVRQIATRERQREQIRKLKGKGISTQALVRRGFDLEEILGNGRLSKCDVTCALEI